MGLDLVVEVNQRLRRYGSQSGPGRSTSPPALGAGDSRTPDKFRADMLHLNPMGYDRLASALYGALDGFENRLQKLTRKRARRAGGFRAAFCLRPVIDVTASTEASCRISRRRANWRN